MELIPNEGLPKMAKSEPVGIEVLPSKIYSWCSCGLTQEEPFCDNAHRNIAGLPFKSIKVSFDTPQVVWFCQCKRTKTPPFCDGTHTVS